MADQLAADKSVSYNLSAITLLGAILNRGDQEIADGLDFGFQIQITHNVYPEEQKVDVTVTASLLVIETKALMAKVAVGYRFDFLNFDQLNLGKNNTLPVDLANSINGLSVSTTRGVFFSQVRGTSLHNVVMPLVDMQKWEQEVD